MLFFSFFLSLSPPTSLYIVYVFLFVLGLGKNKRQNEPSKSYLAAFAEPALKPDQPIQSKHVPKIVNGRL